MAEARCRYGSPRPGRVPQRTTHRRPAWRGRPSRHRGASGWLGRDWCRRKMSRRSHGRPPRGGSGNKRVRRSPDRSARSPRRRARTIKLPPAWCAKSGRARAAKARGKATPVRRVSSKRSMSVVGSCCQRAEAVWAIDGLSARWEIAVPFPPSGSSEADMGHVLLGVAHPRSGSLLPGSWRNRGGTPIRWRRTYQGVLPRPRAILIPAASHRQKSKPCAESTFRNESWHSFQHLAWQPFRSHQERSRCGTCNLRFGTCGMPESGPFRAEREAVYRAGPHGYRLQLVIQVPRDIDHDDAAVATESEKGLDDGRRLVVQEVVIPPCPD